MKSVAAASLFLGVALAQSTVIAGVSPTCNAFLVDFNTRKPMQACTDAIISATAAFHSGQPATSAVITSAFTSLCSTAAGSACAETSVRTVLTAFYSGCSAELTTSPIAQVVALYDTLYNLFPMRSAMCAKTATGAPCLGALTTVHGDSASTRATQSGQNLNTLSQHLFKTVNGEQVPDSAAMASANLPFMFMEPGMSANDMCTTCNREIINEYVKFESNVPYAPGIGQSALLATKQAALIDSIKNTCSPEFLDGAMAGASGLSGGTINVGSGAGRTGGDVVGPVVALAAVFVGIVASL